MRAAGERRYPHDAAGFVAGSATSKAAAEALKPHLSDLQALVLRRIRIAGGLTDAELDAFGRRAGIHSTLRPRRCELLARNIIKDSGTTRKGPSGKPMTVWVLA